MGSKFVEPDPHNQTELTKEQIKFFREKGYLIIRNALSPQVRNQFLNNQLYCNVNLKTLLLGQELDSVRSATTKLIDEAPSKRADPDYWYNDEIPDNWLVPLALVRCSGPHPPHCRYKVQSTETKSLEKPKETQRGVAFRIEYPIDKVSGASFFAKVFSLSSSFLSL